MQEVAAVRGAALDAVDDIVPDPLHDRLVDRLETGSMAPGVLAVLSARAVGAGVTKFDPDGDAGATGDAAVPLDAIAQRGAGVQLIYEGLRLTRTLAWEEPWADEVVGDVSSSDGGVAANGGRAEESADVAILAADILVARGFYLLARTEAAAAAVRVVQSFGRDQTIRRTTGDADLDRNLETDVFELAAVAGTTAVGASPTPELRAYVADLARTDGHLPLSDGLFSEATVETLTGLVPDEGAGSGGVATSADH
jgi:hypothetical protein